MPSLQEELSKYRKKANENPLANTGPTANLSGGYLGKAETPGQVPGNRGIPIMSQTQAGFDREQAAKPVPNTIDRMQEVMTRYDPYESKLQKAYDDLLSRATAKSSITAFNPKRREREAYLGLADKTAEQLTGLRTARVNEAVGIGQVGASEIESGVKQEVGLADVGAKIAELTDTKAYRSAQLGQNAKGLELEGERNRIARLGEESLSRSREAEAVYQNRMAGVAEESKPTSKEGMLGRLELQKRDAIDKIIAEGGEPEEREGILGFGAGPNTVAKKIQAINDQYSGKSTTPIKNTGTGAPSFEDLKKNIPNLTKERYEAFLKSDAFKKRYGGQ